MTEENNNTLLFKISIPYKESLSDLMLFLNLIEKHSLDKYLVNDRLKTVCFKRNCTIQLKIPYSLNNYEDLIFFTEKINKKPLADQIKKYSSMALLTRLNFFKLNEHISEQLSDMVGEKTVYELKDEVADFLKKPQGTEMNVVDIENELGNYYKKNNLICPNRWFYIKPDEKLRKLIIQSVFDNYSDREFSIFEISERIHDFFTDKSIREGGQSSNIYKIKDNLAKFISKPKNTHMTKKEVWSHILNYIVENELIHPDNNLIIQEDNKLRSIFLDDGNNIMEEENDSEIEIESQ